MPRSTKTLSQEGKALQDASIEALAKIVVLELEGNGDLEEQKLSGNRKIDEYLRMYSQGLCDEVASYTLWYLATLHREKFQKAFLIESADNRGPWKLKMHPHYGADAENGQWVERHTHLVTQGLSGKWLASSAANYEPTFSLLPLEAPSLQGLLDIVHERDGGYWATGELIRDNMGHIFDYPPDWYFGITDDPDEEESKLHCMHFVCRGRLNSPDFGRNGAVVGGAPIEESEEWAVDRIRSHLQQEALIILN